MSQRDTLIQVARAEVGTAETGNNNVKYNTWYYGHEVNGSSYAWCHAFVAWCADQAGMLGTYIPKTAGCDEGKNWYSNKGWYRKSAAYGGNYTPQAGDIIYFSGGYTQSDSTHVGIVYKVDSSNVYYINGNCSDKVKDSQKPLDSKYIIGYGAYGTTPASGEYDSSSSGLGSSTSGTIVSTMMDKVTYTKYTASSTDTLSSIANKYHTSVSMLLYLNENIDAGTYLGGKKLKVPVVSSSKVGKVASSQRIKKSHTTGVTVSRPYAKVAIYTETGMLSIKQELIVKDTTMDSDILSIITNRDMQQDCPTFTITLSFQREWYGKIGSNDLVIIQMTRPPENKATVMFGLVDDVRKTTDYNSATPTRAITVTGRGFGKAFARFEIGTLSELNALSSSFGFMTPALLESITSQPPATVCKLVTEAYIGKGCNYHFSNGKSYMSYYQPSFKVGSSDDKLTDTNSFLTYEGSLWNLLKEVKNAPFNEMFWEVINERPSLIFRPTPFNENDWTKLLRITIRDLDIISEDLGHSDIESYVVYKVDSDTFFGETDSLVLPLWYPPYYHKYGLTRLSVSSKYLYGGTINHILDKTQDLFNWNILNNAMENGTITVKGSNQYKVGSRVIIESTGIEYYVEGVQHSFTFFEGWTTQLSVTRGIKPNKRFASPWGAAQQLTQEDATSILGYDLSQQNAPAASIIADGAYAGAAAGAISGGAYAGAAAGGALINGKYTQEDYNYMVGVISSEAWDTEIEDMKGVAWTVMNRVKSSSYPNTVKGVVTQKSQFTSPWSSYIGKPKNNDIATVAKGVLSGTIPNPIGERMSFKSQSYYNAHRSEYSNPIILSAHGNVYHS